MSHASRSSREWDEIGSTHSQIPQGSPLWHAGPTAHLATNVELVHEPGQLQVLLKQDVTSPAQDLDWTSCAELKIQAAFDFIYHLPPVIQPGTLVKQKSTEPEAEDALRKGSSPELDSRVPSPPPVSSPSRGPRRRAGVMGKPQNDERRTAELYFAEANRLRSSLTAAVVRDICRQIYDAAIVEIPPWNLRISSVEAALLAWDLTSRIHGSWRVALTMVTQREGRRYSFVFVVVVIGDHLALLGKYMLKDISFLPLRRQKFSDVVEQMGSMLCLRGHDLLTLYLGMPTEASIPDDSPTFWRLLKLSCRRQEWHSVLATCDFYLAKRREVQDVVSEEGFAHADPEQEGGLGSVTKLPRGLGFWSNSRGELRLKATPPLLVRRRVKRAKSQATPHSRPARCGGMTSMDKGAVSNLSFRMGQMEQKHRHEQEVWHHLSFPGKYAAESIAAVEWPPVQESECSSVSSASLDEYAEDFYIDRHQLQTIFRTN